MNRDEKLSRAKALSPTVIPVQGTRAMFPREPKGGSWIAVNDRGLCVALINWHRIDRKPPGAIASRGEVVKSVAGKVCLQEIEDAIRKLPLQQLRPFRLLGFSLREKKIVELRWDLEELTHRRFGWGEQHWFSSGYDELSAERKRRRVCANARKQKSSGTLPWLRRLHQSHLPGRGPFSVCMHRSGAATVSYTEVAVSNNRATMRYKPGSSCSSARVITKSLRSSRDH